MYLKLSIRNAKRSFSDYLLYMTTMSILLAVMEASYCEAMLGKSLAGFQTASLPVLIILILVALICYIDTFMLKQRAKEFASYLLMGMDKRKLPMLFLGEFWMIGLLCFFIGATLGVSASVLFCAGRFSLEKEFLRMLMVHSLPRTFFGFCVTEGICSFHIGRRIKKLQIRELLDEKKRNQRIKNVEDWRKWGLAFLFCFIVFSGGMCGIVFLPETAAFPMVSLISVPLLCSVFTFYRWLFSFLCAAREKRARFLYRKEKLYPAAQLSSNYRTDALLNSVFCICLLFSAMSFLFGILMFQPDVLLYGRTEQEWMGFLQCCLCVIFFVIYFSILSLLILMEAKREAGHLIILYYMGKSRAQIRSILRKQIAVRLSLPMVMAALLLFICIPLLDWKLRALLPDTVSGILPIAAGIFCLCALFFYLFYFAVVCRVAEGCLPFLARERKKGKTSFPIGRKMW